MDRRLGYSLPFAGLPLARAGELIAETEALGYTDAWSSETDGLDAFIPLALAAQHTRRMRLGTAIVSAFTRGPLTLAMSAAGIAELAPGRFCLGLGASSNVIVERWNDTRFERPLSRVRDTATILRAALGGERVTESLDTVAVSGLRLSRPPSEPVPIFLAALRGRMLRLAGRTADGVLLNWLGPDDVAQCVEQVRLGEEQAPERSAPTEIAARIFLVPGDSAAAELTARRAIAAYMTVPVYAEFQAWLGRGEALSRMSESWLAGDRRAATEAIPEQVLHDLVVIGDAERCRERVAAYHAAGIDTVILDWLPSTRDPAEMPALVQQSLRDLAPAGESRSQALR